MSCVVFSHGHLSSPESRKIQKLAPIAERAGYEVEAIDYRDLQDDPVGRAERLIVCLNHRDQPAILVGSSMGGYVSMAAAERVPVAGLFLLAPALFMENHVPGGVVPDAYSPKTSSITVIHGWNDDVIPWKSSLKFAEQSAAALHLLDTDHRMDSALSRIEHLFESFLELSNL